MFLGRTVSSYLVDNGRYQKTRLLVLLLASGFDGGSRQCLV